MLLATNALILRYFPYGESGMIAHIFTRELGHRSVILQGLKSKNAIFKRSYLLPLFEIDTVLYEKSGDGLRRIKESKPGIVFQRIHTDQSILSMLYFIAEILEKTLREDDAQPELYDFVIDFLKTCDTPGVRVANMHLYFLFQLARFLGFEPERCNLPEPYYWDLRNGVFQKNHPDHPDYVSTENSAIFNRLLNSKLYELQEIPLSGSKRTELLRELLHYFYIHRNGMQQIKSLSVLEMLFH